MLPNPKNKNINNLLPNIENQGPSEAEINQKKLKNKRFAIILSLFLTVGLSFLFWSFKKIQYIIKSPPSFNLNFKINLPKISINNHFIKNKSDTTRLQKFFQTSSEKWSVLVFLDSNFSQPIFEYQSDLIKNQNDYSEISQKLSQIKPSSQSLINLNLPQGLVFQEFFNHNQNLDYQGLISLPSHKITILIKINQPKNLDQGQNNLPQLVDLIYWYSVSFLN